MNVLVLFIGMMRLTSAPGTAMAKRRKSAKKAVDKWKLKRTYKVVAPTAFGGKVVGEIISSDPITLFASTLLKSNGTCKPSVRMLGGKHEKSA